MTVYFILSWEMFDKNTIKTKETYRWNYLPYVTKILIQPAQFDVRENGYVTLEIEKLFSASDYNNLVTLIILR